MCSSGAYINIGHAKPRMRLSGGKTYLNDVPAYAGFAAADMFIGATAIPDEDPRNKVYPGQFRYGGGHVIEDLVAGKDVRLVATAYGTDCYPRKRIETYINIRDLNEAVLFNIRNAYQNYNVGINCSDHIIYTYMGILQPRMGNVNYATCGQLSPLMNDPYYETIGIGTRILLGGGTGFIAWNGTQHSPEVKRSANGVPMEGAGTVATIGDLKQMSPKYLQGTSMTGYGATLSVGIGVPIPILNERVLEFTTVRDEEIIAPIIDYSDAYPQLRGEIVGEVSYGQLQSGSITLRDKQIPTGCLSSRYKAREIAGILKKWIENGQFSITERVAPLPQVGSGVTFKPLKYRPLH